MSRRDDGARRLAVACARAADDKLGEDVVILDVSGASPIADYMVIATATSAPHMRALAESVDEAVERQAARLHHREGGPASSWVLLDCHDVLVHLFDREARERYDLERLWDGVRRVRWRLAGIPAGRSRRRPRRR